MRSPELWVAIVERNGGEIHIWFARRAGRTETHSRADDGTK